MRPSTSTRARTPSPSPSAAGARRGMSQRGAQAMAQQGLGFEDMLAFYYPGTQLRTLSLTDTTGSGLHDGGAPDVSLGQVACISGATLYASASTTSAAVGYVPAGALVEVYEAGETWSYLGYGGLRGWGQTALFVLPGAPSPSVHACAYSYVCPGRRAVVTMGHANGRLYLRSGPSTGTVPVGTVRHGDVVTAYGTAGEWTAVETGAGQRGYLKSKYLVYSAGPTLIPITPTPAVSPTPAATPTPTAAPPPRPCRRLRRRHNRRRRPLEPRPLRLVCPRGALQRLFAAQPAPGAVPARHHTGPSQGWRIRGDTRRQGRLDARGDVHRPRRLCTGVPTCAAWTASSCCRRPRLPPRPRLRRIHPCRALPMPAWRSPAPLRALTCALPLPPPLPSPAGLHTVTPSASLPPTAAGCTWKLPPASTAMCSPATSSPSTGRLPHPRLPHGHAYAGYTRAGRFLCPRGRSPAPLRALTCALPLHHRCHRRQACTR